MSDLVEHVGTMQDHWWWRPGWQKGRHFYACHFAVGEHAELVKLVQLYQQALEPFPGLDPIPASWLHMTMQGIGFVDELSDAQTVKLEEVIRRRVAKIPTPVVTFHRPVVRAEAVYLPGLPPEPIRAVRDAVRIAIGGVLGQDHVELAPEHVPVYRPHVSVAYSNSAQAAEPIADAISGVEAAPVTVSLSHVGLLEFHRDNRMYEWNQAVQIPIGH
ncbi:2'-5' RNA ligase family protein [Micromonospora sp. NPDC048835]|uniref:2'-5' RNA ligase family protein n=1 Tax=Micromonospora sp. NPDC048835 TaxID=3155147 RepID=UPI0033E68672